MLGMVDGVSAAKPIVCQEYVRLRGFSICMNRWKRLRSTGFSCQLGLLSMSHISWLKVLALVLTQGSGPRLRNMCASGSRGAGLA
jgi:hypothetical protein